MKKITFLLLFSVMCVWVSALTRYVKVTASGTGDGTSWANAAGSFDIQTQIDAVAADANKGEVQFAAGTYLLSASINLQDGVNLKGSYAPNGSDAADFSRYQTILDAQNTPGVRLLTADETKPKFANVTNVTGFVLQRGNSEYGSAVHMSIGVVLENCIIRNNTGNAFGAAVYAKINLVGNTTGNNCKASGALINCIIINNTSSGKSGAVFSEVDTHIGLINCVIANNACSEATTGVGGVYLSKGIHWSQLQNNIFYKNSGAATNLNNIKNATTQQLRVTLHNWFDNTSAEIDNTANLNLLKTAGNLNVNNKFSTDISTPDFVLPTTFAGSTTDATQIAEINASNWRLTPTSQLIGLGNSTQGLKFPYENMTSTTTAQPVREFSTILTDLSGSTRIIGDVDMGAYEYNPSAAVNEISIDNNLVVVAGRNLLVKGEGNLEVYNIVGRLITKQKVSESTVSMQQGGVFLVKLTDKNIAKMQKIVVL